MEEKNNINKPFENSEISQVDNSKEVNEQKITTTTKPRVTLRKLTSGYGWDIALSESGSKEELDKIIDEIISSHEKLKQKFEP